MSQCKIHFFYYRLHGKSSKNVLECLRAPCTDNAKATTDKTIIFLQLCPPSYTTIGSNSLKYLNSSAATSSVFRYRVLYISHATEFILISKKNILHLKDIDEKDNFLSVLLVFIFKEALYEEIICECPLGRCFCFSSPGILGGGGNDLEYWEKTNTHDGTRPSSRHVTKCFTNWEPF